MSEMKMLKDVCKRITDGSHYSPPATEEMTGYPMLSVKDMGNYDFDFSNCKLIDKDEYDKMVRNGCVPLVNDVVIAKDGSYLKEVFVITEEREIAILSSIGILRPDTEQIDPYYLKYYLTSDHVKYEVGRKYVTGSALPRIILDNFGQIEIPIVPIETQISIVSLLKDIDSKISNNNAICSDLENMAKLLYDYWFIQFDFPDENGKPYKSSGGKMVWNEELKREIPEGWEVKTINNIVDVISDKISSKEIGDRFYVPIEVIPRNKMSFSETADIDKAATGLCTFKERAILLSNRRVYFHKVSISPFDGVTRDTVIIMYPKIAENLGYVYQIVNSDHFIEYATRNSYGTEQPVLATPTVLEYKYPYSPNKIDMKYSKAVEPLINKVLGIQRENQQLASLRDFLLPMLMNGQVKIGKEG